MSTKHKRRIKYLTFTLAPALLIALLAAIVSTMSTSSTASALESPPCNSCHNNTSLITGKAAQWGESKHGTGTAFIAEGPNKSCAGCHSGGGFSARIAAGLQPNQVTVGDPNPTPQDCRACHQIHNSYTGVDWALETIAPVNFYAIPGKTFDGGQGNLCASCHQPRTKPPVATNGTVTGITNRFGPHHGPQSSFMLGTGGAGPAGAAGTSAAHYQYVENTCVGCHMGANDNHTYEPNVAACKVCHTTATNFDINGVQTTVQAKSDQLKGLLVSAGLLGCTVDADGVESCSAIVTSAPENQAYALYNWIVVAKEDRSKGVHNPAYANALLDQSLAAMGA
jgi:hypothetical protein